LAGTHADKNHDSTAGNDNSCIGFGIQFL